MRYGHPCCYISSKILANTQARITFSSGGCPTPSNKGIISDFDTETKIPKSDALLTPPDSLMKKRTKLPRVEYQTAPLPRVDPDEESKNRYQKLLSTIQTTPSSEVTRKNTPKN